MSIPFDIFYQISILLDDRDFIHLSRTHKTIHEMMKNDVIARKMIEVRRGNEAERTKLTKLQNVLLYSKEGQSAMDSQVGYYKAISRRFDVHEAIATAAPYSVTVLAYAADFLYNNGFLCNRVEDEVRLLDVHGGRSRTCDKPERPNIR